MDIYALGVILAELLYICPTARETVEVNNLTERVKQLGPAQGCSGWVCVLHFGSLGFTGLDPGCRPTHHHQAMLRQHPT